MVLDEMEQAGRIILGFVITLGVLLLLMWATWYNPLIGVAILAFVGAGVPMLWAILAPILRWWRRRT